MIQAAAVPKVTAIIIVFNGERFIQDAIQSVQSQTFESWELLVVDDGSTDRTRSIVERVASSDRRIRLLAHPDGRNHGMSATRNVGIAAASGPYLGFLDADDRWLPDKLREQVAILDREPKTGMVYGRTRIWYGWSAQADTEDFFYELGVPPDHTYDPPTLFHKLLLNRYQTPTTCNALMRRDVVQAVGGFDPAFRTMFEDQLFFAKVLANFRVHVSDRCWALYRQHDHATSARESEAEVVARAHLRFLRALSRHIAGSRSPISRERLAVERRRLAVYRSVALLAFKRRARRIAGQ